jgi:hypothetical protein
MQLLPPTLPSASSSFLYSATSSSLALGSSSPSASRKFMNLSGNRPSPLQQTRIAVCGHVWHRLRHEYQFATCLTAIDRSMQCQAGSACAATHASEVLSGVPSLGSGYFSCSSGVQGFEGRGTLDDSLSSDVLHT